MTAPAERLRAALAQPRKDGLPQLAPYITAGYPHRDDTVPTLLAIQDAGCAAVEIGIPFSDPLADGPTIQRSGTVALANGMTTDLAIDQAAAARQAGVSIPVAFMTYVNLVLSHGLERFCSEAAAAGVDALILPDLPDDEATEVRDVAARHGLGLVPLLAPTSTEERIARACGHAHGFVYCVSVTGITGARESIAGEAFALLDRVRAHTSLPRALGFGLSTHGHLASLRGRVEAAAVGSALISAMGEEPHDPAGAAGRFLRGMLSPG
ncbi:MAG: tryptophan synthase subunit alpha [Candidatus Dormibacteria bacterium]